MFQIFAKINGTWKHIAFEENSDKALSLVSDILSDHKDNRVHIHYLPLPEQHKIDMINDLVNKA